MRYKAYAKINLLLEVINQRSDGYHTIKSFMTPIDLYDIIEVFDLPGDDIKVTCDDPSVPTNKDNTVYKAALLLKHKYRIRKGVRIDIKKRIPHGAGLGGGSSDAGIVLRVLIKHWKIKISVEKLNEIALEIGADVPFFLNPVLSQVDGIGEIIKPMNARFKSYVLVVVPDTVVSTRRIYKGLNLYKLSLSTHKRMQKALLNEDYKEVCRHVNNHLESSTMTVFPEVHVLKNELLRFGFDAVLMSGSGSAVFALTRDSRRLDLAAKAFSKKYDKVFKTSTL
jgi:4-diphosphocytidyl-2-C-methyl-D-erythritol kinase